MTIVVGVASLGAGLGVRGSPFAPPNNPPFAICNLSFAEGSGSSSTGAVDSFFCGPLWDQNPIDSYLLELRQTL